MQAPSETKVVPPLDQVRRRHSAALWLHGVFGGAMVVMGFAAANMQSELLWSVDAYLAWSTLVALIHFLFFGFEISDRQDPALVRDLTESGDPRIQREPRLPWFQRRGQPVCLVAGGLLVLGALWGSWGLATPPSGYDPAQMRLAGSLLLGIAFALHFMGRYVASVQSQQDTRTLNAPLYLARLGCWICLVSAAGLFTRLYMRWDFGWWLGRAVAGVTALLVVETWIRAGLAMFQPRALLAGMLPAGGSVVLEALCQRGNPVEAVIYQVESLFGVKVGHGWVVEFLRQAIEPVILVGIVLVWLSTSITAVPPQSHGVRVRWGRYLSPALEPGLYVTWPWPAETIKIIPTERIEQITLGFEEDLGGPALWTETHYEGEQNLLVGNGEELLAISVPIYFRIKDPLAFLKTTTNAREALISLAYRQLLSVTEARDSFRVMTVDRQEISRSLKESLQREVDRMHLGLEVVFVGLKDIHPPVPVAPSYQDVISAEEEKLADLHKADAYHLRTLAEAGQQANRVRTEADAMFQERIALASGESARFLMLASADAANTNLFRLRLRLEALERALAKPQKVVLTRAATTNEQFYLDLRGLEGMPLP